MANRHERYLIPFSENSSGHHATIEKAGLDLFVVFDGLRIAKRGAPGTPQAGQWVSIAKGYEVSSPSDLSEIEITHNGIRLH